MSSRAIVVLMFVLAMMTSCATTSSTIEHCLRLQLDPPPPPPPPPPPHAVPSFRSAFDLSHIVCRDMFRSVGYSIRSTRKLPLSYLGALCNIFGDNEQKVWSYITNTFRPYDFHRLIDGRSCATIRNKQHPLPPSPLSRL